MFFDSMFPVQTVRIETLSHFVSEVVSNNLEKNTVTPDMMRKYEVKKYGGYSKMCLLMMITFAALVLTAIMSLLFIG